MTRAASTLLPILLVGCASSPTGSAYNRAEVYASTVGVRPSLATYVMRRESGGNMRARAATSSATGAMQVIDGTAAAIAQRPVSRSERMTDTGIKLGVAYLAACQQALPGRSDHVVWRSCYYWGHAAAGADIRVAQAAFQKMEGRW
jgi:hypothetical protein